MPTREEIEQWPGREIVGIGDEQIGTLETVFTDGEHGQATFGGVKLGLLHHLSLFPLNEAKAHEDAKLHVPYDKKTIKDAPGVSSDSELTDEEKLAIHDHYGQARGVAP